MRCKRKEMIQYLRTVILCLTGLWTADLSAQHGFSGIVTEAASGTPLPGVSIIVESDPGVGTVTEADGSFVLSCKEPAATLIFTFLGYASQTRSARAGVPLKVELSEDTRELGEVVVTALGIKRQKRELGYSTERFQGSELLLSNGPNIVQSLSGRSAGVQVIGGNGVDGGTTRFVIRGNNNITANNQPLIVVDGVPMENDPGLTDVGRGVDWGSAINNINPADIEDVNILKGPTAAALYGSRGANGVVLITTRRGRQQAGIGIQYVMTHKVIQPCRYRSVQNTFGAGGPVNLLEPTFVTAPDGTPLYPREVHALAGPYGKATTELFGYYSTGMSWGPRMEGQLIKWWDGELRPFDPQPDNLRQFFDDGHTTSHNLSFSGGGKHGTMRVSLTRTGHTAIVPNSRFDQTTVNIGSRLDISARVKADISFNYIHYHRLNSPTLGDNNDSSFGKGILYSWPRSYKGLERELNLLPDGTRNEYDGQYPFTFAPPHLWWNTFNNNTELNRNKLLGALALTYDITPWLNLTSRVGTDFNLDQFETRNRPTDALGLLNGLYSNELGKDIVQNNDVLLTAYKENIAGSAFQVKLSLGATQWRRERYGLQGTSGRWVNPRLYAFNNFDNLQTGPRLQEFRFEKRIHSAFAFLNLGYRNFAFLELTGRNDWTSSLPSDANSYFYPSASLSLLLSEVLNISRFPAVSFLKVRAAYAQTATDTDPYQVDFVYTTGQFGGAQTASLPTTIPPIALRPQQADSYEIGTTLGLWRDKINLDLTWYHIRSFDQILNAPIPASAGASQVRINTGELRNHGWEAILSANLLQRPGFFWQTSLNISRNRNEVVRLGDGADLLELANIWGLNGPAIAVRAGESYGTIIGYDHVYHPANGQPILNDDGTTYRISDTRVPLGNAAPDFLAGWSMRLGFKGWTLSTLVDTKWGGDIYAGSYVIGLQTGQSPQTLPERSGEGLPFTDPSGVTRPVGVILPGVYENGVANDKVVHYYFKYIGNTGGWGRFISRPGVLDNSWVKLRELALHWTVPENLQRRAKVFQDLMLSFTGRDLFYLYASLPDRINPEGSNGAGNAQGLEWASFPGTRSFTIGLQASF
ncbi:MAG: hypothetical protein RLY31_3169 [Bacteroidota bacterium]|jgi:iron complex outermembrane receptor protein